MANNVTGNATSQPSGEQAGGRRKKKKLPPSKPEICAVAHSRTRKLQLPPPNSAIQSVVHPTFARVALQALEDIEGISSRNLETLRRAGVKSLRLLIEKASTRKSRVELAEKTGISDVYLLNWVSRADLYRISGIGPEYAALLEAVGIDSPVELARRSPHHLHVQMVKRNADKKLVRRLPSEKLVSRWVETAKNLPRAVQY
jgi:predicted flap endonuclease-1-like 5' DNA nuclease